MGPGATMVNGVQLSFHSDPFACTAGDPGCPLEADDVVVDERRGTRSGKQRRTQDLKSRERGAAGGGGKRRVARAAYGKGRKVDSPPVLENINGTLVVRTDDPNPLMSRLEVPFTGVVHRGFITYLMRDALFVMNELQSTSDVGISRCWVHLSSLYRKVTTDYVSTHMHAPSSEHIFEEALVQAKASAALYVHCIDGIERGTLRALYAVERYRQSAAGGVSLSEARRVARRDTPCASGLNASRYLLMSWVRQAPKRNSSASGCGGIAKSDVPAGVTSLPPSGRFEIVSSKQLRSIQHLALSELLHDVSCWMSGVAKCSIPVDALAAAEEDDVLLTHGVLRRIVLRNEFSVPVRLDVAATDDPRVIITSFPDGEVAQPGQLWSPLTALVLRPLAGAAVEAPSDIDDAFNWTLTGPRAREILTRAVLARYRESLCPSSWHVDCSGTTLFEVVADGGAYEDHLEAVLLDAGIGLEAEIDSTMPASLGQHMGSMFRTLNDLVHEFAMGLSLATDGNSDVARRLNLIADAAALRGLERAFSVRPFSPIISLFTNVSTFDVPLKITDGRLSVVSVVEHRAGGGVATGAPGDGTKVVALPPSNASSMIYAALGEPPAVVVDAGIVGFGDKRKITVMFANRSPFPITLVSMRVQPNISSVISARVLTWGDLSGASISHASDGDDEFEKMVVESGGTFNVTITISSRRVAANVSDDSAIIILGDVSHVRIGVRAQIVVGALAVGSALGASATVGSHVMQFGQVYPGRVFSALLVVHNNFSIPCDVMAVVTNDTRFSVVLDADGLEKQIPPGRSAAVALILVDLRHGCAKGTSAVECLVGASPAFGDVIGLGGPRLSDSEIGRLRRDEQLWSQRGDMNIFGDVAVRTNLGDVTCIATAELVLPSLVAPTTMIFKRVGVFAIDLPVVPAGAVGSMLISVSNPSSVPVEVVLSAPCECLTVAVPTRRLAASPLSWRPDSVGHLANSSSSAVKVWPASGVQLDAGSCVSCRACALPHGAPRKRSAWYSFGDLWGFFATTERHVSFFEQYARDSDGGGEADDCRGGLLSSQFGFLESSVLRITLGAGQVEALGPVWFRATEADKANVTLWLRNNLTVPEAVVVTARVGKAAFEVVGNGRAGVTFDVSAADMSSTLPAGHLRTATRAVTIVNRGSAAGVVENAVVVGPAGRFALLDSPVMPVTIPVGGSWTRSVFAFMSCSRNVSEGVIEFVTSDSVIRMDLRAELAPSAVVACDLWAAAAAAAENANPAAGGRARVDWVQVLPWVLAVSAIAVAVAVVVRRAPPQAVANNAVAGSSAPARDGAVGSSELPIPTPVNGRVDPALVSGARGARPLVAALEKTSSVRSAKKAGGGAAGRSGVNGSVVPQTDLIAAAQLRVGPVLAILGPVIAPVPRQAIMPSRAADDEAGVDRAPHEPAVVDAVRPPTPRAVVVRTADIPAPTAAVLGSREPTNAVASDAVAGGGGRHTERVTASSGVEAPSVSPPESMGQPVRAVEAAPSPRVVVAAPLPGADTAVVEARVEGTPSATSGVSCAVPRPVVAGTTTAAPSMGPPAVQPVSPTKVEPVKQHAETFVVPSAPRRAVDGGAGAAAVSSEKPVTTAESPNDSGGKHKVAAAAASASAAGSVSHLRVPRFIRSKSGDDVRAAPAPEGATSSRAPAGVADRRPGVALPPPPARARAGSADSTGSTDSCGKKTDAPVGVGGHGDGGAVEGVKRRIRRGGREARSRKLRLQLEAEAAAAAAAAVGGGGASPGAAAVSNAPFSVPAPPVAAASLARKPPSPGSAGPAPASLPLKSPASGGGIAAPRGTTRGRGVPRAPAADSPTSTASTPHAAAGAGAPVAAPPLSREMISKSADTPLPSVAAAPTTAAASGGPKRTPVSGGAATPRSKPPLIRAAAAAPLPPDRTPTATAKPAAGVGHASGSDGGGGGGGGGAASGTAGDAVETPPASSTSSLFAMTDIFGTPGRMGAAAVSYSDWITSRVPAPAAVPSLTSAILGSPTLSALPGDWRGRVPLEPLDPVAPAAAAPPPAPVRYESTYGEPSVRARLGLTPPSESTYGLKLRLPSAVAPPATGDVDVDSDVADILRNIGRAVQSPGSPYAGGSGGGGGGGFAAPRVVRTIAGLPLGAALGPGSAVVHIARPPGMPAPGITMAHAVARGPVAATLGHAPPPRAVYALGRPLGAAPRIDAMASDEEMAMFYAMNNNGGYS